MMGGLDESQMCCYICGYVAQVDEPYEIDLQDGEEFPICPECGEDNCGGWSSYAPAGVWQEEDLADILTRRTA